jgi:hypothetical protein
VSEIRDRHAKHVNPTFTKSLGVLGSSRMWVRREGARLHDESGASYVDFPSLARLHGDPRVAACQSCWTVCRGFAQALGERGTRPGWVDLVTRMRSQ